MTLRSYGFGTAAGEAKILDQIDNMAAVIQHAGSNPINPQDLCRKAAASMIFGLAFGKTFSYEDSEFQRIIQVQNTWLKQFLDPRMTAIEMLPVWLSKIVLYKYVKQLRSVAQAYKQVLIDLCQEHIRDFDPQNPRDVVDGYLKERGVENFDPEVMASIIMAYSTDAIVTVSSAFTAILFYLAKYPDVQSRVQEQLDAVIGGGRRATMKDRSSLPLVDAVVFETLRLLTPAAMAMPRVTPRDTTLGGYHIPKGTVIIGNLWGIHFSPSNYQQPKSFSLDNFLEQGGSLKKTSDAWMPFGLGRKNNND